MIELQNISKTYYTGKVALKALHDVSLAISPGEFIVIMGPSGSGKSTLMHILGFLDRPDAGGIYKIFGKDLTRFSDGDLAALRNHLAGFVFQQFHLLRRVTARENVALPLIYAGKKNIFHEADKRLAEVGLNDRALHRPNELSGGQQQRVAIARALVNDPTIIFADEPTGNLDSKSGKEIMGILKQLNGQGKTIIVVTHDREIAQYASRVITMRDGKVLSDEKKSSPGSISQKDKGISLDEVTGQTHSAWGTIEFFEHLRQSFHAILSNKTRSILSMMGILFGVGAVIAMLALGEGAKESLREQLKSLGSNLLMVRGGSARIRGVAMGVGSVERFTFNDVSAIRALSPLVAKASGRVGGSAQTVYENANWNTSLEGVGYDYGQMRATVPAVGQWFTPDEIEERAKVTVLGMTVVKNLFGDKNPVGETIKINRINFKVIGIAPPKGSGGFRDQDDVAYIPVTTAMYRVLGKDYLDTIFIEVSNENLMEQATQAIENLIIKRHRLNKDDTDSFHIRDMSEIQDMLSSTTQTMSMLLGCIAAISLLVGGVGIMNIMLVSVTERTREIGLRKALGARKGDIMTQFLIEAVVMTFSGGLMGIALGSAMAVVLAISAGWATRVTPFSIVLATTFSITVGIGFGLWPAKKASELNPIEALRYE
ncbi:MAG: ABC transporter permease [Candidatus Omnitrophica bacterium]|nr:ABC transporter permease [Candidatus Omnitrophota bacterium]